VEWLKVCMKLRASGMPLPEIRHYAQLVLAGAGNEAERHLAAGTADQLWRDGPECD
jgi:hypothetical protein